MKIVKLLSGPAFDLYAIAIHQRCQVEEYISSLDEKDQKQVFALLNFVCEKGPPTNEEKFRNLGDKIYELKTRRGHRILSFFGGSTLRKSLVLTHAFPKPKPAELSVEKKKAVQLHEEYLETADKKKRVKSRR